MKAAAATLLVLALAGTACGDGGAPRDDLPGDLPGDALDGGPDAPPADLSGEPGPGDTPAPDAPGPDGGPSCESILKDWQCLEPGDCPAWQQCTGPETCLEPPCWGVCQDYPGACLPAIGTAACPGLTGCGDGQGCAGMSDEGLGACRGLPDVAGSCWTDEDCPVAQRCAGEVRCDPARMAACADHPGLCLPRATGQACLDDDDCGAGRHCQGATLCAPGAACADVPGTCVAGERASCRDNGDCADTPDNPFCVAAGPGERGGWCAPAPFKHAGLCWQDSDCAAAGAGGEACSGAAPCPPGRRCRAGGQHAGYCMAFPLPAPDDADPRIVITYTGKPDGDPEGLAVIRNGLPVAIVVPACMTLNLETARDGAWPAPGEVSAYTGWMNDALCPAEGATGREVLRIPAGGSRTLKGLVNTLPLPAFKRFELFYRMGCDGLPDTSPCSVIGRSTHSGQFR